MPPRKYLPSRRSLPARNQVYTEWHNVRSAASGERRRSGGGAGGAGYPGSGARACPGGGYVAAHLRDELIHRFELDLASDAVGELDRHVDAVQIKIIAV